MGLAVGLVSGCGLQPGVRASQVYLGKGVALEGLESFHQSPRASASGEKNLLCVAITPSG